MFGPGSEWEPRAQRWTPAATNSNSKADQFTNSHSVSLLNVDNRHSGILKQPIQSDNEFTIFEELVWLSANLGVLMGAQSTRDLDSRVGFGVRPVRYSHCKHYFRVSEKPRYTVS